MPATETRPLLQEILAHDPYRLLVGCVLLNVTTRRQADRVWPDLFCCYPTAAAMSRADPEELAALLRPLGCHRKRAETLRRLAHWVALRPPAGAEDVLRYPGCGKYASDSWAIFREGRLDVEPNDGVLVSRLAELRAGARRTSLRAVAA